MYKFGGGGGGEDVDIQCLTPWCMHCIAVPLRAGSEGAVKQIWVLQFKEDAALLLKEYLFLDLKADSTFFALTPHP